MKTMIAFRIEESTRKLIADLQRRGNYRSQAELIQAAIEALDEKISNQQPQIDVSALEARLERLEGDVLALQSNASADSDDALLARLAAIEGQLARAAETQLSIGLPGETNKDIPVKQLTPLAPLTDDEQCVNESVLSYPNGTIVPISDDDQCVMTANSDESQSTKVDEQCVTNSDESQFTMVNKDNDAPLVDSMPIKASEKRTVAIETMTLALRMKADGASMKAIGDKVFEIEGFRPSNMSRDLIKWSKENE